MIKATQSKAQKQRYLNGMNWETKIHNLFIQNGIMVDKKDVETSEGKKISDHTFGNIWMESTTHIDSKRKDELIKKKSLVMESSSFDNFIIFYKHEIKEDNPSQAAILQHKQSLKDAGFMFFDGTTACEAFISFLGNGLGKGVATEIPVAKPIEVDISDIYPNELNREINKKAELSIAKSIVNNGFFGAFFCVPRIVNGKQDGYTLFEAHHRYGAFKKVIDWGLNISAKVPVINVHWLDDTQKEKLGELLIKVNVEYRAWQLYDYVQSHLTLASQLNNEEKVRTYEKLVDLRPVSKKLQLGYNGLWYVVGPKDSKMWLDSSQIQDGTIRFDSKELTLIDSFVKVLEPILRHFNAVQFPNKKDYNVVKENLRGFLAREYENFKVDGNLFLTKLRLEFIKTWTISNYPQTYEIMDGDDYQNKIQTSVEEQYKAFEAWEQMQKEMDLSIN
jgi:hypothetical protein